MKSALKALVIIWLCISVLSLPGLLYLLPSYGIVGAFAGAFKTSGDAELTRWFLCELGLTVGILRTAWLWRAYRKHYGPACEDEHARALK
jgi:hypothetical protein